jgi:hypothetical protein
MTKASILILCLICTQAFSASVTWIDGLVPPSGWNIEPNDPGTSDTITFSGPLNFIYGSSCSARGALGGTPQITVDNLSKQVILSIQGPPPTQCPAIWQPVCGLQGEFGPLPTGHWTFKCTVPEIAFNIAFTVGTPASIYYVDQDAPGPIHNGANWLWAFNTIQDALAVSLPGDTILVAEGIYKPDQGEGVTAGDREASFLLPEGLILRGGHAGFGALSPDAYDPKSYVTELSGDLAGDDLYGLLNTEENSYHVVSAMSYSTPNACSIQGVVIKNGRANGEQNPNGMGGGLLISAANVVIWDSLLSGNRGGLGGAVAVESGSITVVNSRISGNTARLYGAGVYAQHSSVILNNCLITGNTGYRDGFMIGPVIHALNSSIYVNSCTVADNLPSNNKAIASLGWVSPPTHELIVTNSILYNGGNEIFTTHPSTTQVSRTNVQGGWTGTGTGNINADPLFTLPGVWSFEGEWIAGNYHLKTGSPCIDKGSTALLPPDVTDLNANGNTTEALPLDLDGLPRTQGTGTDMGVYETEIIVTPPPVEPEWAVADSFNITHTPSGPWSSVRLSATITTTIQMNFKGELSLKITPTSPAGGDWTATFITAPGIIGPGSFSVKLEIVGENVDLSKVTTGVEHDLAELLILVRPVSP